MAPASSTAPRRIWITDGSLVPFDGVVTLAATHPATLGLQAKYKGLVDPAVPVGSATLAPERAEDVLIPEAEWCLTTPDGLAPYVAAPGSFTAGTPVILQGIIEGKWLNRLAGERQWAPASIGNNLLAEGPGIATTLAALEAGIAGEVTVDYRTRSGTRRHRSTLADLRGQNLLGLVQAVLAHCAGTQEALDAVDFSAMGEEAAPVNERARVRAALRFDRLPIFNPLSLVRRYEVGQRVIRGILADDLGVVPGTAVELRVLDGAGVSVGRGRLTLASPAN